MGMRRVQGGSRDGADFYRWAKIYTGRCVGRALRTRGRAPAKMQRDPGTVCQQKLEKEKKERKF